MTKPTVVWFQAVTCNGNTHSFLSSNANRMELFLDQFELLYHPSLTTELTLSELLKSQQKIDYLLIEGAITDQTKLFQVNEMNALSVLQKLSKVSTHLISVGSCASFGGVHAKFEHNSSIAGVRDFISHEQPIINLTGCPVHPEWIMQTLFTLKDQGKIALDEQNRPSEIYGYLAHHGCTRNEYFEWKVESDHFGLKEGCLYYEQGCRGPMTHSNCNKVLWNEVSSKTRAGMPCIGCTEFDFPRDNLFETKKNIGIPLDPPIGVPKRAYLSLAGVAKTFKIDRLMKPLFK